MIATFLMFMTLFVLIGLSSVLRSRHTEQDYYLARQSVAPYLAGLSAVASNNSGYMFIGVNGHTTGLASIWLLLGWILGDSGLDLRSCAHRARQPAEGDHPAGRPGQGLAQRAERVQSGDSRLVGSGRRLRAAAYDAGSGGAARSRRTHRGGAVRYGGGLALVRIRLARGD
jgi:hypothetical protein